MNTKLSFSRKFAYLFVTAVFLFALSSIDAHAATFSIILNKQTFAVGDEFTADIKMNTENVGINAAQGTISFLPSILSVSKVDRSSSVFNFWLQEPTFSNSNGTISFLGGSTNGFTGASLEVFRATFKVNGIGSSTITFTDGAITASDGSGTNVMSATKGVEITSTSKGGITVIPAPIQIKREPVPTAKLPIAPKLSVPLYPDQSKWYNVSAPFNATWELPSDVTRVATLINKDPRSTPNKSEGLFDNKSFPILDDGIWYLHVQFGNINGWGPVTHHALKIDSTPPTTFNTSILTGAEGDDPTPTISFASADTLSSVASYYIIVDNKIIATTTETKFELPPQKPGKHILRVSAHDNAENATESIMEISITPIASPATSITNTAIFAGEGGLTLSGSASPKNIIILTLKDEMNIIIAETSTTADATGNWNSIFNEPLKIGSYKVEVIAIDERGAQSIPTNTEIIKVRERPLLTLGSIRITKGGLIWMLIILFTSGIGVGFFMRRRAKEQQTQQILIAKRDVVHAFAKTKEDIVKILDVFADDRLTEEEITRMQYILKKLYKDVSTMEQYIIANISEIKE